MYCVDFFINTIQTTLGQLHSIKCLWMEVSLHRTAESHFFNDNEPSSQMLIIFQIYEKNLLPKLVTFINNYIKWDEIAKKDKR